MIGVHSSFCAKLLLFERNKRFLNNETYYRAQSTYLTLSFFVALLTPVPYQKQPPYLDGTVQQ